MINEVRSYRADPTQLKWRGRLTLADGALFGIGAVAFTREPDDHTDIVPVVHIARDVYEDLGSPDVITVTIRPGDRLN